MGIADGSQEFRSVRIAVVPDELNLPLCFVRTLRQNEIPEFLAICKSNGIHTSVFIENQINLSEYIVAVLDTDEIVGTCCAHLIGENRGLITGMAVRVGRVNWLDAQINLLLEAKRRLSNVDVDINFLSLFYNEHNIEPYTERWYVYLYQVFGSQMKLPEIENDCSYEFKVLRSDQYPLRMTYFGQDDSTKCLVISSPTQSAETTFKLSRHGDTVGYGEVIKYGVDKWILGPVYAHNDKAGEFLTKNILKYMSSNNMKGLIYTYLLSCNRNGINLINKAGFMKPPIEWIRCSTGSFPDIVGKVTYSDAKNIVYLLGPFLYSMF